MDAEITEVDQDTMEVEMFITWKGLG